MAEVEWSAEVEWTDEHTRIIVENTIRRKYVARADDRQKAMGLSYIEAEREDLIKTIIGIVNSVNKVRADLKE